MEEMTNVAVDAMGGRSCPGRNRKGCCGGSQRKQQDKGIFDWQTGRNQKRAGTIYIP